MTNYHNSPLSRRTFSRVELARENTDTHIVGGSRKLKCFKAVRVSCPRKFIINNHIFSFFFSFYIVHYTRLRVRFSHSLLCVYGSCIALFLHSFTFPSFKNNSASNPRVSLITLSYRRTHPQPPISVIPIIVLFLYPRKKSLN